MASPRQSWTKDWGSRLLGTLCSILPSACQAGESTDTCSLEGQKGPKALPLAPGALSPYPCSGPQLAQRDLGQAQGCERFQESIDLHLLWLRPTETHHQHGDAVMVEREMPSGWEEGPYTDTGGDRGSAWGSQATESALWTTGSHQTQPPLVCD